MQINKISFKGYQENNKTEMAPDKSVLNALDSARPYLKRIGDLMPGRNLVVTITNDKANTYLSAFDENKASRARRLLAKGNEHTLTEYGLDFVEDVFRGLEKNNPEDFKNIAVNFAKSLSRIIWNEHPVNFSQNDWPCSSHD